MKVIAIKGKSQGIEKLLTVAIVLIVATGKVWAIGDSGGCTFPSDFARKLEFGTVAKLEGFVEKSIAWRWDRLPPEERELLLKRPEANRVWRQEIKNRVIRSRLECSHGERPLDRAVATGNLEVVRWLLDAGVDPNASSFNPPYKSPTIFSRCSFGMRGNRPDGMTKDDARKRMIEAYRMVIAYGADINISHNKPGFHDPLIHCLDEDMYPILKLLGADVSNSDDNENDRVNTRLGALRYWVQKAKWGGRESPWRIVKELAKDGNNDLRGTKIENEMNSFLDIRKENYDKHMEDIRRLTELVRFNPGSLPNLPVKPEDVPDKLSPIREACSFPETKAFPNFELVVVWRKELEKREPEIIVGKTMNPLILALHNHNNLPLKWVVKRTDDANILGVIVLDIREKGRKDSVSFDPKRPVYLGPECWVTERQILDRNWKEARDAANRLPNSTNPFRRTKMAPNVIIMNEKTIVVGEPPAADATLVSWPENIRSTPPKSRSRPVIIGYPEGPAGLATAAYFGSMGEGGFERAGPDVALRWLESYRWEKWWPTYPKDRLRFPEFWKAYVARSKNQRIPFSGFTDADAPIYFLPGNEFENFNFPANITVYFYKGKNRSKLDGYCRGPKCRCDGSDCL